MTDPISSTNSIADNGRSDIPFDVAGAARELGLIPIRAWVADQKKKDGTSGADRTRRSREKAEQQGLKQLSITLPADLHPKLKTFAARTKSGEPPEAVLAELFTPSCTPNEYATDKSSDSSATWLDALPAWRRWLLRWLMPSSITKLH